MLELLWHFCQASPSLPLNCLEVSAVCQRFADPWGFFFLVLFSHHSIVILRN